MSRIVIADPQSFTREALRLRLTASGHEVLGDTGDGREAARLVPQLHPDLVILDLELPRLGGVELIRRLRSANRRQKILVFTGLSGAYYRNLCLQAGASGFVDKHAPAGELDDAVRMVLGGHQVFPAGTHDSLEPARSSGTGGERLTPRELTVLQYLAQGYRVKEIADELAISDRTVSTYKTRLLEKTQTASLVELIESARERGLLGEHAIAQLSAGTDERRPDLIELLDVVPTAMSLRDPEGRLLTCNQKMLDISGKTEQELRGTQIFRAGFTEADSADSALRQFRDGVASKEPFSIVVPVKLSGERRILRTVAIPLLDADSKVSAVISSYVDITDREQYVERLQEAKAGLDALRARRGALLLASGKEQLIQLDKLHRLLGELHDSHPGDERLVQADAIVETLRETIDILVDSIRIEQGSTVAIPQLLELNQLTADAITRSGQEAYLRHSGHETWAWIDPNRYHHLVNTLLTQFARVGIVGLGIQAASETLEQGELHWKLTLSHANGAELQAALKQVRDQERAYLARNISQLLGGTLQLGEQDQPDLAALIQLKLTRGRSRN